MSKDQLQSLQTPSSPSAPGTKPRRNVSFLLPVGLLFGFLVVFAVLFGPRLLPAVTVQTSPVITLRNSSDSSDSSLQHPEAQAPQTQTPPSPSQFLFQASGWIEPDPYITYVPTLQNGVIDQVHVLEGQTVRAGDLLATLVQDDAKLNLQQAQQKFETMRARIAAHCSQTPSLQAKLEAAQKRVVAEEARLKECRDTYERLSSVPEGTVPLQKVTQARLVAQRQTALLEEAQAEIPRLEAELTTIDFERIAMGHAVLEIDTEIQRAQLALDRTSITAPMDGIVLHLHAAPGQKRMLNMDDPKSAVIVELYDPQKLQARIDVPLNEASQLSIGQPVTLLTDLLPDTEFTGAVTRIVGEADLQRNTLQVKVCLDKPDLRLRPEMLVRAKFYSVHSSHLQNHSSPTSPSRLALYAPANALINVTETTAQAWVVSDQRAELRDLTLGFETREGHRQVLTGLRSGEHLIHPPHTKLKPGIRVTIRKKTP